MVNRSAASSTLSSPKSTLSDTLSGTTTPGVNPFVPKAVSYAFQAMVVCPETRQNLPLNITAQGCKPHCEVSLKACRFGECPVNEVRDVLLTVKNGGSSLPFNFSINKVSAHLACGVKSRS